MSDQYNQVSNLRVNANSIHATDPRLPFWDILAIYWPLLLAWHVMARAAPQTRTTLFCSVLFCSTDLFFN